MTWKGVIREFREFMPLDAEGPVVTLAEGGTPLVRARGGWKGLEAVELYFKYEGGNPTGSFKDRGMTVAMSAALRDGARAAVCASTGNTAASAAAYAARAGIRCAVLVPEEGVALGKLAQASAHGARVVGVRGSFDMALELVRRLAQVHPLAVVNSLNPLRLEGQKTAAFEICDDLGEAPAHVAIPVGNAGNITAYWRGFKEYLRCGRARSLPRMLGFQAEGAAPLVRGEVVLKPVTLASAIRIGNPASWAGAVAAAQESGGGIFAVSDEEIVRAWRDLASREGLFVEPASAASFAGVRKLASRGFFRRGDVVACVLTGHGLKDPQFALSIAPQPVQIDAVLAEVEKAVLEA